MIDLNKEKMERMDDEEKSEWEYAMANSANAEMHFPGNATEFMKERGYERDEHGDFVSIKK